MVILAGHTHQREGRAALERAIDEARLRQARLHVVHVLVDRPADNPARQREWAETLTAARREGAAIEARLADLGIDGEYEVIPAAMETPGAELVEVSRRVGADLVVIGIRRRSPVGKVFLGSVAQEVLLGTACKVLAVKAQ